MSDTTPSDQKKSWKSQDVDKGFAWVTLTGCFMMYMFVVGSVKAYGVLYTEMIEYYSSGAGNTGWIGSIAMILLLSLGPIANLLCRIYTFRRITFIGGVLLALGYSLSGFVTRMEYMYLTFLSTGLGHGLTFAPCSTIICYYFDKRRALANGITVAGSSVGAIAFPFLYKYLIEEYGLRGTLRILGAIFANVCVAACIFRQPRFLIEEQKERIYRNTIDESRIGDVGSSKSDKNTVQKIFPNLCSALDLRFSLFKNASFTLYLIAFMCCSFGVYGSLILIPASVKELGYDKTYVALSVTIFGVFEIVSRIFIGRFADLNIIQRKHIFAISMFIGGTFSLFSPFFGNFTLIAVYSTIVAVFPASLPSLMSVLVIEVVGMENFSPGFGLLSISLAVANIPSQPVIGWLFDLYGNWLSAFILVGCVYIIAVVIILLEPIIGRCCKKSNNKEINSLEMKQGRHDADKTNDDTSNDAFESTDTGFTA